MNTTDANKFIHALNRIAEATTLLAAAIEESVWEGIEDHAGMPGARPIAAAQLAQPSFDDAIDQTPPANPTPPVEESVKAPVVGLEDVRAVLADLSSQGLTSKVKELITQAGAEKLSAVDPGKYAWLLEQARGLSDA